MEPSLALARWIYDNYPYDDALTHLKVQKLLFYCVGTAMAFDLDGALRGDVLFQPWAHGPVNVSVWHEFKDYKGAPIPIEAFDRQVSQRYPESVEQLMKWVLQVYGALDAWRLRRQSHLEQPWIDAYENRRQYLDIREMREYFKKKWTGKTVYAPEHLQDPGTFTIDDLPVIGYRSLQDLAESIYVIYGR